MPIGSAICGTGRESEKSALKFSTRKPVYLNTTRQPRSNTTASVHQSPLCPRSISSPNAQLMSAVATIKNTYTGSPQA